MVQEVKKRKSKIVLILNDDELIKRAYVIQKTEVLEDGKSIAGGEDEIELEKRDVAKLFGDTITFDRDKLSNQIVNLQNNVKEKQDLIVAMRQDNANLTATLLNFISSIKDQLTEVENAIKGAK